MKLLKLKINFQEIKILRGSCMELIHSIFIGRLIHQISKTYDIDRPSTGGGQTYLEAAGIDTEELIIFYL